MSKIPTKEYVYKQTIEGINLELRVDATNEEALSDNLLDKVAISVSMHDELVAALERAAFALSAASDFYANTGIDFTSHFQAIVDVNAALAKARGEE